MNTTIPPGPMSPLRQRMIEDMTLRQLAPTTQSNYLRAVKKLNLHLGHSPHTATAEDLRCYQLHLVNTGISKGNLNATLTGLKFFFETTLERIDVLKKTSHVHEPRKLPIILSPEEVSALINAAPNLEYKAAFSVAYGAGLRSSEVVGLKVDDIDNQRMTIRVEQGKGDKDRYCMLSPILLQLLRDWWKAARAKKRMLDHGWLFPGQSLGKHLSTRQLNKGFHRAAEAAGIYKRVSMHSLRHAFATHLLEKKVDIRVIQVLLGHKKIETTALYCQVATKTLNEVTSPLDYLALQASG